MSNLDLIIIIITVIIIIIRLASSFFSCCCCYCGLLGNTREFGAKSTLAREDPGPVDPYRPHPRVQDQLELALLKLFNNLLSNKTIAPSS